MKKFKLQAIESEDKREGKYQVALDPLLNADLQLYIEAYRAAYPQAEDPKPDKIIAAIVQQFIASDSTFARHTRHQAKTPA
jgi:hypothetical protein